MALEPVGIVDDNPRNLKLAKVILAAEGYAHHEIIIIALTA